MISRRRILRGGLLAAAGVGAGYLAPRMPRLLGPDRLPLDGGYAPAGNAHRWSKRGSLRGWWHVRTSKPWVALTFDDGPSPEWTPMVLDALDRAKARATFFVVGKNLREHGHLVKGRYARHEIGNHTWGHKDLAERTAEQVRDQVTRCHDEIESFCGRTATLLRPPWGHLAGTTLTVADDLGYDLVLWSQLMREDAFEDNPPAIAKDTADQVRPGSIILAHDVGARKRLVALTQLERIVAAIRAKGLELVTVTELLNADDRT